MTEPNHDVTTACPVCFKKGTLSPLLYSLETKKVLCPTCRGEWESIYQAIKDAEKDEKVII